MKNILVLTDFSINADYAAQYALALARYMQANLLLCNIYATPEGQRLAIDGGTPFTAAHQNSMEDLGELQGRLKTMVDRDTTGAFRPEIIQCSVEGSLNECLPELAKQYHITLAVISKHRKNVLPGWLTGDHAYTILETATFPVLVIPYQVRFSPFRKLAFASASKKDDTERLKQLYEVVAAFNATVLIAHISTKQTVERNNDIDIAFPNLQRLDLQLDNVARGLAWLAAQNDIDLLVLQHRKRSRLQQLFNSSITRKLAGIAAKPLLVLP